MVFDEVTMGSVGSHDGQAQNSGVLLLKVLTLKEEDPASVWRPYWVRGIRSALTPQSRLPGGGSRVSTRILLT